MKKLYVTVILSFLFLFATSSKAELQLEINVDSTILFRGDGTIEVPVYLSNFTDTVVAFQLWFQLDRPDIALFQMSVNTSGSIIADWGSPNLTSLSGFNTDISIIWFSDPFDSGDDLLPQSGGKLFSFILDPVTSPEFPSSSELNIMLQISTLDKFSFSTPNGTSIGIITQELIDSSYFDCTSWDGATCLNWVQVVGPVSDSIAIDTILYAILDTSAVHTSNGVITTTCCDVPGDFNFDGTVDIGDLTFRVSYMFKDGPAPSCQSAADVNASCGLDIIDLTYIVNFMFKGGASPICGCID